MTTKQGARSYVIILGLCILAIHLANFVRNPYAQTNHVTVDPGFYFRGTVGGGDISFASQISSTQIYWTGSMIRFRRLILGGSRSQGQADCGAAGTHQSDGPARSRPGSRAGQPGDPGRAVRAAARPQEGRHRARTESQAHRSRAGHRGHREAQCGTARAHRGGHAGPDRRLAGAWRQGVDGSHRREAGAARGDHPKVSTRSGRS